MDRSGIQKAVKLLAKAESTDSDAEAVALATRSYRLIAETLNAYEAANENLSNGPRRRERRLIKDRRAWRRSVPEEKPATEPAEPVDVSGYARSNDTEAPPRRVDYSL